MASRQMRRRERGCTPAAWKTIQDSSTESRPGARCSGTGATSSGGFAIPCSCMPCWARRESAHRTCAHHRAACRAMAVGCESCAAQAAAWGSTLGRTTRHLRRRILRPITFNNSSPDDHAPRFIWPPLSRRDSSALPNRFCCPRTSDRVNFATPDHWGLYSANHDAMPRWRALARSWPASSTCAVYLASITSTMASIYGRSRSILAIRRRSRFSTRLVVFGRGVARRGVSSRGRAGRAVAASGLLERETGPLRRTRPRSERELRGTGPGRVSRR